MSSYFVGAKSGYVAMIHQHSILTNINFKNFVDNIRDESKLNFTEESKLSQSINQKTEKQEK